MTCAICQSTNHTASGCQSHDVYIYSEDGQIKARIGTVIVECAICQSTDHVASGCPKRTGVGRADAVALDMIRFALSKIGAGPSLAFTATLAIDQSRKQGISARPYREDR